MATDVERRRRSDGSSTTSATAAEDTPLLRSETSSSLTSRDVSPRRERQPAEGSEEPLSRTRATCIVLSMWALIFLQGKAVGLIGKLCCGRC